MSWRSPTIQIYESSPTKTLILPITKYFGDRHAHFVADTHKNGYPNHEKIASFINDLQSGFQKRIQIGELPSCALYFGILLIWPRGNLILLVPKQWILFFVEPSCTSYWLGAHIPIFWELWRNTLLHCSKPLRSRAQNKSQQMHAWSCKQQNKPSWWQTVVPH